MNRPAKILSCRRCPELICFWAKKKAGVNAGLRSIHPAKCNRFKDPANSSSRPEQKARPPTATTSPRHRMTDNMVAFPPPKATRKLAGVEFSLCKLDDACRRGIELAKTHGVAGVARGDGPEITWAIPLDHKKTDRCWLCWTHNSKDWYQAFVPGPQFLNAWRAIVDEVAQ